MMILTPTLTHSVSEIIEAVAKIEWQEAGNEGEPHIPTLLQLQQFTKTVDEHPDFFVTTKEDRYDALSRSLMEDIVEKQKREFRSLAEEMTKWAKMPERTKRELQDDLLGYITMEKRIDPKRNQQRDQVIFLSLPDCVVADFQQKREQERDIERAQYEKYHRMKCEHDAEYRENARANEEEWKRIMEDDRVYIEPEHFEPYSLYMLQTAGEPTAERLEWLHKGWLLAREDNPDLKHPLGPLVKAWLTETTIPKIKPERQQNTGIIHDAIRDTFPSPRSNMTVMETMPGESEQLMLIKNLPQVELQLELPDFVFPESELVPALPLKASETVGGRPSQQGRGAPISQRLFFNILVEYELKQRGLYHTSRLNTNYRDVKSWLYPNGTTNSKKKIIPSLYKGLYELHNQRFLWKRRAWNIIAVDTLPTIDIKPDDPLTFTIRMPDGMNTNNGARIGIEPMRIYGARSAPKFRAWIRLAYLWDAAKIRSGGSRIYATIPEVLRNNDRYLVDAKGEVILTGNLYRTKHGWKFRDGNNPQTAWYHPLAIRTGGTVRNPEADKMPILCDSDMVKLFFDRTERRDEAFRKCLLDAKNHALKMEKEGRVVVEQDQTDTKTGMKGWRILEPYTPTLPD